MVLCCRILIGCALLATIASTLRVYPHQLAYFNEAAGGPQNGHRHLLHSNLDLGQDFLNLKNRVDCGQESFQVPFYSRVNALYDIRHIGLVCKPLEVPVTSDTHLVVSINTLFTEGNGFPDPDTLCAEGRRVGFSLVLLDSVPKSPSP
jgi:hypothetical protein